MSSTSLSLQRHSLDSVLRLFGRPLTHVLPPCRTGREPHPGGQLSFNPDTPCLGQGSFGTVRLAKLNGYDVVTKVLKASQNSDVNDAQNRVEEEGLLLAKKRHNHIVSFYGYSRVHRCIVTEYCPNGSLFDFIRSNCSKNKGIREDFRYRLQWLEGIAAAFVHLHLTEPCVIHRDLKSSNVVLDKHYEAKVTDFGLARIVDLFGDFNQDAGSLDGDLMLLYQAPEISLATSKRSAYSFESDVYSYGILMQEILTLENPYGIRDDHHINIHAAVYAIANGNLSPTLPGDRSLMHGCWHQCLEPLVDLFYKCVDRNPSRRPDFRTIYDRIREIREAYEKTTPSQKIPRFCTIKRTCFFIFVFGTLMLACFVGLTLTGHKGKSLTPVKCLGWIGLLVVFALIVFAGIYALRNYCGKRKLAQGSQNLGGQGAELSLYIPPELYRGSSVGPSPFELAADGNSNFALPSVWHSVMPTDWPTFCRGVLEDLDEDSTSSQVASIRQFCSRHSQEETLDRKAWAELVHYFLHSTEAMQSPTWREYERRSNIHHHVLQQSFQGSQFFSMNCSSAYGEPSEGETRIEMSRLSNSSDHHAYNERSHSAKDGEIERDWEDLGKCHDISRSTTLEKC